MDAPRQCWFCKATDSLVEQVDKLHGNMVHWKCTKCGAITSAGDHHIKKRRK